MNKDAGNLNSRDHNATVLWHVQNRYEKWKRHKLGSSEQSTTAASPAESSFDTVSPLEPPIILCGAHLTYLQGVQLPSYPEPLAGGPSPSSECSIDVSEIGNTSVLAGRALSQSIGDVSSTTPLIDSLIAFAYRVVIPARWPRYGAVNEPSYELAEMWKGVTDTAIDNCYANAYFAVIAGLMAQQPGRSSMLRQSRQFQTNAITILQDRTQSEHEIRHPLTFRAILYLFTSETMVENTAQARIHLKMLQRIVADLGGLAHAEPWLKENLVSGDAYFALKTETRPLFPTSDWSPGSLSAGWRTRVAGGKGRVPRHPELDASIDSRQLKELFRDLRELSDAHSYVLSDKLAPDEPLLRWVHLRKHDCTSRIANTLVDIAIKPHLFASPAVQSCACLALAILMSLIFGSPEPLTTGRKLVSKLELQLRQLVDTLPSALEVWLLYISTMGARVFTPESELLQGFSRKLSQVRQESGLESDGKFLTVLRGFVFSDKTHREILDGRPVLKEDAIKGVLLASGCSWRAPLSRVGEAEQSRSAEAEERPGRPGPSSAPSGKPTAKGKGKGKQRA